MIYLLANTYREAAWWCEHQDPPINPRGREVVILLNTESVRRLMGRRFEEGDRVITYHRGPERFRDKELIQQELDIVERKSLYKPEREWIDRI